MCELSQQQLWVDILTHAEAAAEIEVKEQVFVYFLSIIFWEPPTVRILILSNRNYLQGNSTNAIRSLLCTMKQNKNLQVCVLISLQEVFLKKDVV